MAAEIIPIELGLTAGNGLTLWAQRWQEDGEEWEAFLGHEENLYVFPDAAHLAAFVRTSTEHDLLDHPEWDRIPTLLADELVPDEDHRFDIVGLPDKVAASPDLWTLAELADTVAILRSLAEVCDLPQIDQVLDASDGFALLTAGERAFAGRAGMKLWNEMGTVVAERWDEVLDALDEIVTTPDVDAAALAAAQDEAAAIRAAEQAAVPDEPEEEAERDPDLAFWDEIGLDCLNITVDGRTGWTLRCYLSEAPLFLAKGNRIQIYSTAGALENHIADATAAHSLTSLAIWPDIQDAIAGGDAAVVAGPENTYVLDGLAEELLGGPEAVDAHRLDLAIELLTDAGVAREDSDTAHALSTASSLSRLVTAIVEPSPEKLPPAPPFDDESAAYTMLVERFTASLDWDPA